jgi:HSP20 family molecular chaperone IbpA
MTEKKKIAADICSYVDEEHCELKIEMPLPGVEKKDIKLKMLDDSFSITAPREDFDYVRTATFCCPVKASDAVAHYENGLLKIAIPFKGSMEGAVDVLIN